MAALLLMTAGSACAMNPVSNYDFSPQGLARYDGGPRQRSGTIQGFAYDAESREPIDGLVLRLCDSEEFVANGCYSFTLDVRTDEHGMFLYEGLPPGRYRVHADGFGMQTSYFETGWDVTVRDREITELRAALFEYRVVLL